MKKKFIAAALLLLFSGSAFAAVNITIFPAEIEARQKSVSFQFDFSWSIGDTTGFVVPISRCKPFEPVSECSEMNYSDIQVTSPAPNSETGTSGCEYRETGEEFEQMIVCEVYGENESLSLTFTADNFNTKINAITLRRFDIWYIGVLGEPQSTITRAIVVNSPEVIIVNPIAKETVSGTVLIMTENVGAETPDSVEFWFRYEDGTSSPVITDSDPSDGFSIEWNTEEIVDGTHRIIVQAWWDSPERLGGFAHSVDVKVNNSQEPEPTSTPTPLPDGPTPTPGTTPIPTPTTAPTPVPTSLAPNKPPIIKNLKVLPSTTAEEEATLSFSVTYSDPDEDKVFVSWDFGDGEQASGSEVKHYFVLPDETKEQKFKVKATVQDARGGSDSAERIVTIKKKSYSLNLLEPIKAIEKGKDSLIKIEVLDSDNEERESSVIEAKLLIGGKEFSLENKDGVLEGTISGDYTVSVHEDAVFEAIVGSRRKNVNLHLFIDFKPGELKAGNPFAGLSLFPGALLKELEANITYPNGITVGNGVFFAELTGTETESAELVLGENGFVSEIEFTVSEEDARNGIEVTLNGIDEFGNVLNESFQAEVGEKGSWVTLEIIPAIESLSRLNYGQPLKLTVALVSDEAISNSAVFFEIIEADKREALDKKSEREFSGNFLMPSRTSLGKVMELRIVAETEINGKKITVLKKQVCVLSKELNVGIEPIESWQDLGELNATISYANMTPFEEHGISATLTIDGKTQKINLERVDENLFRAVLSEPVKDGEHELKLVLTGVFDGDAELKTGGASGFPWDFLFIGIVVLALGGILFKVYSMSKSTDSKEEDRFDFRVPTRNEKKKEFRVEEIFVEPEQPIEIEKPKPAIKEMNFGTPPTERKAPKMKPKRSFFHTSSFQAMPKEKASRAARIMDELTKDLYSRGKPRAVKIKVVEHDSWNNPTLPRTNEYRKPKKQKKSKRGKKRVTKIRVVE